jgi:hypothetical protein
VAAERDSLDGSKAGWRNKKVENPGFDPGASSLRTTHSTD